MSSQNTFPGPMSARPVGRPPHQANSVRQPTWINPQSQQSGGESTQVPQAGIIGGSWQPPVQGQPGAYAQAPYGTPQPNQPPQPYAQHWDDPRPSGGAQPDPYAPQFEPYVPPARGSLGHQQPSPQWPGRAADPRGFDVGAYGGAAAYAPQPMPQQSPHQSHVASYGERPYHEQPMTAADWAGPAGGFAHDSYDAGHAGSDIGFAQAEGGEVDAAYGDDEDDYEEDEVPRGRRPMMILAALVGAIMVGGGMAYGYKKFTAGGADGDPPIVKSEALPSKTKPADAGGKQFPYAESKIMGRLGDGSSSSSASDSDRGGIENSDAAPHTANGSSVDEGGARKVATFVVGRDGTIQSPPAVSAPEPASPVVSVPGTSLVDVFGNGQGANGGGGPSAPLKPKTLNTEDASPPSSKTAAATTPLTIPKADSAVSPAKASTTTGSIDADTDSAAPTPKKKPKKIAHTDAAASSEAPPAPVTSGGTSGFVAVLASVPASSSSRIDALKRFADMQQKYGSALAGKTPDVAEANLGAKGNYHRLIVGPPGSREQASNVCTQLKSQGYTDCWVTTY